MKPTLKSRRERVRRVNAKRPQIVVEPTYAPKPDSQERLISFLVDLLARAEGR